MEQKTRMVLYEFLGCDSCHPLPDAYRKHASFFGAATAAMGLLGLSGWILGMPLLASIRSSYIPMAPLTAIAFLCLGGVLLVHSMGSPKGPVGLLAAIVSALLSAYGLIELIEYLGMPVLSLEERLFPDPPMIGAILTGRMSPTTAALLLLSGAVVPMLFLRERGGERQKFFGDVAGCLGILSAVSRNGVRPELPARGSPALWNLDDTDGGDDRARVPVAGNGAAPRGGTGRVPVEVVRWTFDPGQASQGVRLDDGRCRGGDRPDARLCPRDLLRRQRVYVRRFHHGPGRV